jgi:GAF domain-containing protein
MSKIKKFYESLYQAASDLNSTRAPEAVLRSLVENVAKATEAKTCSLMLLTPDRKVLLHTVAYGLSDWYLRKGPIKADRSISEALEGKPVRVLNVVGDERVIYKEQAKKEGIASILSVPMMLRGEVIGVVRVYTSKPYHFSDDEIYFVEAVANPGAIAMENARLYDTVQKDYDAFRSDMLQWRAELGNEWLMEPPVLPTEEQSPVAPPGG